ncbi:MAG TPA: hypothetical protein DCZ94_12505 [Lentisphaeria bacterium]|nr:MAG: hypothetical protein A2X48_21195 [Lentisphaerae bacterium GWF2_49_21]HBC87768.1 hypothetical protein [Lentisphaeria bacterium]
MPLDVKISSEPKKKMRHKKKRILFYSLSLLIGLFLVFDIYCETKGLPSFLERRIERKFLEKGMIIKIRNARVGIFHGINLDRVTVMESQFSSWELLKADSIRLSFPLSFKGFSIDRFSIHNGNFNLPVFPETGAEGLSDVLNFRNIEADIRRAGNDLEIKYATTSLNGFLLNITGNLKGVFVNGVFVFLGAVGLDGKAITPSSSLSALPLNARTYFYNELKNLQKKKFASMPLLQLHIDLNAKDIYTSSMECKIKIPSFKLRNYAVDEISGNISLKDKSLRLDNFSFNLGKSGQLKAAGSLDLTTLKFKGSLDGRIDPSKYIYSADGDALNDILIPEGLSDVEITVGNYSVMSYSGDIRASLSVPRATLYKVAVRNMRLNATVSFDESERTLIHIDKTRLSFDEGESLEFSGEFDYKAKKLSGDMSGRLMPGKLLAALDEKTRASITPVIKLGNEPFTFKGHIEKLSPEFKDAILSVNLGLPSLQVYDASFKDISAVFSLNGRTIKATGIDGSTPEGNKIDGEMEYCIPDDHLFASLHSTGNPAFVHKTMFGAARKAVEDIYNSFKWPEKNESVEMTARMNLFMKAKPFFNLAGTVVASDFQYNGVHFDYGACSYYTDTDYLSVVQKIVLQQEKNSALVSLVYDNRPADEEIFPDSDIFTKLEKNTDKLYFELESTLPGNSILKCIIPGWNSSQLNISGRSPLKLNGMIDFTNDDNTYFTSKLTEAQGEWAGIPLSNATASISMKKQVLEIKDLTAKVFNGDLAFSYDYNLKTNTGKMAISVDDAEFAPLVKNLGYTEYTSQKIGSLSGETQADLSYNEKDELLMNGKGKISLKDANIWDIPMLNGFTDMLGKSVISSDWGEISNADCNFTLEKDHFNSDSIQTDGNAIALSASGKYYWSTSESDFKVRAKMFKNVLPFELVAKLMDPLSWALEARLRGKGKDLKWEQIRGLIKK